MAAKKETRPKVPPKAMPKPRGSLQAATARSKVNAAQLVSSEMPAEHEFADSRYSEEPKLHRDVRLFFVNITYFVILKNDNPIQGVVAEGVANHSHDIEIAIVGDEVDPEFLQDESVGFPTHASLSNNSINPEAAIDEVAQYYGNMVANRLVKDSGDQIQIKAVSVHEQQMPTIFINGIP